LMCPFAFGSFSSPVYHTIKPLRIYNAPYPSLELSKESISFLNKWLNTPMLNLNLSTQPIRLTLKTRL
jgi:hypothetical protein